MSLNHESKVWPVGQGVEDVALLDKADDDVKQDAKEDRQAKPDEDLLAEIQDFLQTAQGYWDPIYEQGRADKEFVTVDGAQWDAGAKKSRDADGLPSLEINLVRTYCRQQINTQRQNRPQIEPVPVDGDADVATAKTIKGLVKDTEIASDAESAYDAAAENAVYGGIGFIRVTTDYVGADSFAQEPKIVAIHNPESVYIDPTSKALDGSDNRRALVLSWLDRQKVMDEYGEDAVDDFAGGRLSNTEMAAWYNQSDSKVLIAEYFCIESETRELCLLADGQVKWRDKVGQGDRVVKSRMSSNDVVRWYKVSGSSVLDRTRFVGQQIPIVPVYGEVTWIGERRHVLSLVHFAKDPQRLYNYWKSTEAHQLSEISDAPYLATPAQLAGFEDEWQHPKGLKVLHYNDVDDATSKSLPPPQRQGFPASPSGVLNAAMGAQQSIVDVLNMHAPAMGHAQNDQSGVALGKLQNQQETSNFHFADNLNKSIAQVGRLLLPCYQAFYSEGTIRRILGEDGKSQMAVLNSPPTAPLAKGQVISKNGWLNDLTVGRYDIRMQTGANFVTQRQETAAMLQALVKVAPQLMQIAPDLIVRTMDGVGINEIADRLERTVPPQIKDDPAGQQGGQPPLPPGVAQQMQQLDGLVQHQQQQLSELTAQVNDKQAERQHKEHLAQLDAQVKLQVASLNNHAKADMNELTQAVKLMLQHLQVPAALMANVEGDLNGELGRGLAGEGQGQQVAM